LLFVIASRSGECAARWRAWASHEPFSIAADGPGQYATEGGFG